MRCTAKHSTPHTVTAIFAATLCLCVAGQAAAQGATAPAPEADLESVPQARKLELLVPSLTAKVDMRTSVLLPLGRRGPFPLAVVNHGTTESEELRRDYSEPVYSVLSSWLLARGYAVVLPQRPGHGETGGRYIESAGGCEEADFQDAGYATADSIGSATAYVLQQSFAKQQPVLLAGHSAGAWGALALASRSVSPIAGVLNFSGGRGGRSYGIANRNCAPDRLVRAAAAYGRTARVPTLWLYSENDSYFGPNLSKRLADAFRSAGGRVDYRLLPPVGEEGHYLVYSPDALRYWAPIAEKFLARLSPGGSPSQRPASRAR
jgi:pimeloyl-ACP methyl ester carboxylesterase